MKIIPFYFIEQFKIIMTLKGNKYPENKLPRKREK